MIHSKLFGLAKWVESFLRDCRSRELSPFTVEFYRACLASFTAFCASQDVNEVEAITADLLRGYLLALEATGHNPGGRHAKFRAVRVFVNWYAEEAEPEGWNNPIAKVKPPKVQQPPIEGISLADVRALLDTCGNNFTGTRDQAFLLCLLDTGARIGEFLAVNLDDVDVITGDILLRKTKGKRARVVFIGKKSRRALRAYLKQRTDDSPALWVTRSGDRLAVKTVQGMLGQRAKSAGLKETPSPHDFRRCMALTFIRNGGDIFTLARLLGHKDIGILKAYLAQTDQDAQIAHAKYSPIDNLDRLK